MVTGAPAVARLWQARVACWWRLFPLLQHRERAHEWSSNRSGMRQSPSTGPSCPQVNRLNPARSALAVCFCRWCGSVGGGRRKRQPPCAHRRGGRPIPWAAPSDFRRLAMPFALRKKDRRPRLVDQACCPGNHGVSPRDRGVRCGEVQEAIAMGRNGAAVSRSRRQPIRGRSRCGCEPLQRSRPSRGSP